MGAAIYHSLYVLIGGGILPTATMIKCTLLIRRNLAHRQQKRTCLSLIQKRRDSLNQQVLHLLFIQIICYNIFIIPQLCNLMFSIISSTSPNRSNKHRAIEKFIAFIAELILYLFPTTSFYLYILTSRTFRNELIQFLHLIYRTICLKNRIIPTETIRAVSYNVKKQQTNIFGNKNQPTNIVV
jgi:hypothetical protein